MATICEFGTAPEQVKDGYRMIGTTTGTQAQVLAKYEGQDVRLVTGALIFGTDDKYEFAVMVRTDSPAATELAELEQRYAATVSELVAASVVAAGEIRPLSELSQRIKQMLDGDPLPPDFDQFFDWWDDLTTHEQTDEGIDVETHKRAPQIAHQALLSQLH